MCPCVYIYIILYNEKYIILLFFIFTSIVFIKNVNVWLKFVTNIKITNNQFVINYLVRNDFSYTSWLYYFEKKVLQYLFSVLCYIFYKMKSKYKNFNLFTDKSDENMSSDHNNIMFIVIKIKIDLLIAIIIQW